MRRRAPWLLVLLPLLFPVAAFAVASLTADPSSITFPEACVRTTGRPSRVVLENEGETNATDVRVSASPTELFILGGATSIPTMEPGDEETFSVSFAPGRAGSQSGKVTITYDAHRPQSSDSPQPGPEPRSKTVSLKGSGIDRLLDVAPLAVNFGDVRVGKAADSTESVFVYEDGDSPLQVTSIAIVGTHASDFRVLPREPAVVTDGDPLRLLVGFTARGVGLRTAELEIRSNSCDDPVRSVVLSGIGVEPDVASDPQEVDFADVQPGQRPNRGLVITNQGGYELRVTDILLSGADDDDFEIRRDPDLPRRLDPGETIDLRLRFTAREPAGPRTAELVVVSNDPDRRLFKVKVRANVVVRPTPTPSETITAVPTEAPPPAAPSRPFVLAEYAPELAITLSVAAFFGVLILVRRVRGIPE